MTRSTRTHIAVSPTTAVAVGIATDAELLAPNSPARHGRVIPADLRTQCPQSEIAAADARHNARLQAAYEAQYALVWECFEQRQLTHEDFRVLVREAKAQRDARWVGALPAVANFEEIRLQIAAL